MKTIVGNGAFDYRLSSSPLAPVAVVDRETGQEVATIPLHDFRRVVLAWENLWGATLKRSRPGKPAPEEPEKRSWGSQVMQQMIDDRRGR